jgi:hypothetical protein
LPYIAYIVSLWVTVAFVVSRIRRGEVILAAGVLLVMLGHRSIPLTYFNDIVLIGLLLAAMYSKPVTVIEPQVDEVPANLIIADPRDA